MCTLHGRLSEVGVATAMVGIAVSQVAARHARQRRRGRGREERERERERERESATTHTGSYGCLTPTAGHRCPEKVGPNQAPGA